MLVFCPFLYTYIVVCILSNNIQCTLYYYSTYAVYYNTGLTDGAHVLETAMQYFLSSNSYILSYYQMQYSRFIYCFHNDYG